MLLNRLNKIHQWKILNNFLLINPIKQHTPVAVVVAFLLRFRGEAFEFVETGEVPLFGEVLGVEFVFGDEGADWGLERGVDLLADLGDELDGFLWQFDDHFGAFGFGLLCFLIMAISLVMGVLLNLKHRLIAPGHHFLNRLLLILFDLELINIQSVGPLFTAWFLQV